MDARRMGLNKIIQIGFIGVLALMIINGAASFVTTRNLVQSMAWVTHSYEVKGELEKLLRRLIDAETGQRGYLYSSDEVFLEPYTKAVSKIQDSLNTTLELVKDNPAQIQRLKAISDLSKQKIDIMEKTISLHKAGKKDEAKLIISSGTGKNLMDDIRSIRDDMYREEETLLARRTGDAESIQTISSLSIVGGTLLSIAIGLSVLWLINRNFLRPINEVINMVSSVSTEIAATVNQHERTASQQAAAANETSATIEELSISSRKSAEQAANAASMTEKAGAATLQGDEATRQAVSAMAGLKDKIGTMAGQILHLGEQTGQIGGIATVLKDLAGQINMLALNAAVEAARAGEHGKGFAVVASEIRKLADESKKSAEQTALLVADIQKATNSSIMMTEEGTRTVNEVTQTVRKVSELFNSLAGLASSANENAQQVMLNAKQQSAAFSQVVEATNSIASGVKETAAGISQTKLGVQSMNQAAENLKAIA
ncbi:CHASE3 domain-containing protein [Methylomonas sp. LL1]|uniref:CHASE3 domain-containing protein n=1 Tax=Methylomonas sp. LL1 TaxID=2785785 RepID=UPI0018C3C076|nr:CHASE3 domain-containing protein [Methylomonas sp. LL1]QPK62625.1 CHASE3 domain-containing protein [Methylomonas sp. LL1]